jgi:hypothetical protein
MVLAEFIIFYNKEFSFITDQIICLKRLIKYYILPLSHSFSAAKNSLLYLSNIQNRSDFIRISDSFKKETKKINRSKTLFNKSFIIDVHKRPNLREYLHNFDFFFNNNEILGRISINILGHEITFNISSIFTVPDVKVMILTLNSDNMYSSLTDIVLPSAFNTNIIYWSILKLFYNEILMIRIEKMILSDKIKYYIALFIDDFMDDIKFLEEARDKLMEENIKKSINIFYGQK